MSVVRSKITSLLSYENSLWVGTADGHLTIYTISKLAATSSSNGQDDGEQEAGQPAESCQTEARLAGENGRGQVGAEEADGADECIEGC